MVLRSDDEVAFLMSRLLTTEGFNVAIVYRAHRSNETGGSPIRATLTTA